MHNNALEIETKRVLKVEAAMPQPGTPDQNARWQVVSNEGKKPPHSWNIAIGTLDIETRVSIVDAAVPQPGTPDRMPGGERCQM